MFAKLSLDIVCVRLKVRVILHVLAFVFACYLDAFAFDFVLLLLSLGAAFASLLLPNDGR